MTATQIDQGLDVGHRLTDDGHDEFFVLDAFGREVAAFSKMGGPYIGPNAELAAIHFARRDGRQCNFLPSLVHYSNVKSSAIMRAMDLWR